MDSVSSNDSEDKRIAKYFETIRQSIGEVGIGEYKKTLNVAIIGPEGVGKSAIVNSVSAALSRDRWHEYAMSGHYDGMRKAMSVHLISYPQCNLQSEYPGLRLPTLIDIAGFPDEDEEKYEEILRVVLYGRLPQGASFPEVFEYCKKHGVEGVKTRYSQMEESLKVDRIIFVGSSTANIPKNLVSCLLKAARPTGAMNNPQLRSIPIFGVLTKADLVDWDATDVISREKEFIGALGLRGAEHRYMRCTNYCNDTAPDRTEHVYQELDVTFFRFMVQLCDPAIAVTHDNELLYPDPVVETDPVEPNQKPDAPVVPDTPPKPEVNWQYMKMVLAIAGWIIVVLAVVMFDSFRFKRRVGNACTINKEYGNGAMPKEFEEICDNQNGGLMELAFTLVIGGILAVFFAARRFGVINDIQIYFRQN